MKFNSNYIEIEDSLEDIYEYFCQQNYSDGLPIIPPTEKRVEEFIEYSGMKPDYSLGEVPPGMGEASIEKVAINAAMAGCRPEYMPVIIAAVEAMLEPVFNLHTIQVTTNPVAPLVILNGPIRKSLNVNCERGCLGPGRRSNATIGRAIRLILINIGKGVPGISDMAIHGMPGKYTFCYGEDEEGNPWQPLHVERGFDKDTSAVTVVGIQSCVCVASTGTDDPEAYLMIAANAIATAGSNHMLWGKGNPGLILSRGHAANLARAGYSKKDCKQYLFEKARAPISTLGKINVPRQQPLKDGILLPCEKPEDIILTVAGGYETYYLQVLHSFHETQMVTKPVVQP